MIIYVKPLQENSLEFILASHARHNRTCLCHKNDIYRAAAAELNKILFEDFSQEYNLEHQQHHLIQN